MSENNKNNKSGSELNRDIKVPQAFLHSIKLIIPILYACLFFAAKSISQDLVIRMGNQPLENQPITLSPILKINGNHTNDIWYMYIKFDMEPVYGIYQLEYSTNSIDWISREIYLVGSIPPDIRSKYLQKYQGYNLTNPIHYWPSRYPASLMPPCALFRLVIITQK